MEWMWRACGSLTEVVEIQCGQAIFSSLSFSLFFLHFGWAGTMTSAEVELPRNFANNFWVSESTSTMIRKLCNTGNGCPELLILKSGPEWCRHRDFERENDELQTNKRGPENLLQHQVSFDMKERLGTWAGPPIPERMRCSNFTLWTHSPPLFQGSTSWRIWQKAAETFKNGYWKRRDRVSLKKYRLYPLL